jgi:Kef-type K+ transport system membrane component KefB
MLDTSYFLILLGGLFFLSMLVSHLANKLGIPRVTLLILAGIIIGPSGFNWVNGLEQTWFPTISSITLLIIGYLLGSKMSKAFIAAHGLSVSITAISITLVTFLCVFCGLALLGFPIALSALLAAISVATDPTATLDVVDNYSSEKNNSLKSLIRGVVALDDILGLLLFSIVVAILAVFSEQANSSSHALLNSLGHFGYETFGSILLGIVVGFGLTYLLNHKPHKRPVIVESFGLILLCGGIASYLNMSYLLAAMAMGAIVINFAHKVRPHLHEVEMVEQPFLILFFVLAGASLNISQVSQAGWLLAGYVLFRLLGRMLSGIILPSKYIANSNRYTLGLAFTSQAGVAMGMALVAGNQFPAYQNDILTVAISATVLFELIGPLLTSMCLKINKTSS